MKLSTERKAKLEKFIGDIQDTHELDAIYAAGLASLIRAWKFDTQVTGEEVHSVLKEHGMTEVVLRERAQ